MNRTSLFLNKRVSRVIFLIILIIANVSIFIVFGLMPKSADASGGIDLCVWSGSGTKLFGSSCTSPDGCSLEVYSLDQTNSPAEWAKVRCIANAPAGCDPTQTGSVCAGTLSDGLTYIPFIVSGQETGGVIRYNKDTDYSSLAIFSSGGGGTFFNDDRTNFSGDSKDLFALEDTYKMRLVGTKWSLTGVNSGLNDAGRFIRSSDIASTFENMAMRPEVLFQWIDQTLNPDNKPIGILGSSGGALSSLSPAILGSSIMDKVKYLAVVSMAPLTDPYNNCTDTTPLDTYVDPNNGNYTNNPLNGGATMLSNTGTSGPKGLFDNLWNTPSGNPGCLNKFNLTPPIPTAPSPSIAALTDPSSTSNLLQGRLDLGDSGYSETAHFIVNTLQNQYGQSDTTIGTTWSTGRMYQHPYFAGADRIWQNCTTLQHGGALNQPNQSCFDWIFDKLVETISTLPPSANAGADKIVVDTDGSGSETVSLSGSLSSDLDGTIVGYEWKEGANILGTGVSLNSNFALGEHTVTLTVTDNDGFTGTDTLLVTVNPQSSTQNILYFSLLSDGIVGSLNASNEDVIAFDGTSFTTYFDGSDVGLGSLTLDAFSVLNSTEIIMSFTDATTISGISGTVADSDIVKFTATSLGDVTSGSFSMYFDGSDVGLSTSNEDIDAAELLSDGRVLISTSGNFSVTGVSGEDEDIVAFTPSSMGDTTAGTWALYFDGSDVGLSTNDEDVDAVAVSANGAIHLSTTGNFSVTGLSGADEDVFVFNPTSLGLNTAGTFSSTLFFDGSLWNISGNDIFAIDLP